MLTGSVSVALDENRANGMVVFSTIEDVSPEELERRAAALQR